MKTRTFQGRKLGDANRLVPPKTTQRDKTRLMKTRYRSYILIICAAAFATFVMDQACQAQTTSSWLPSGTSTSWFDAVNWTSGVPLAPGDRAQLQGTPKFSPTI